MVNWQETTSPETKQKRKKRTESSTRPTWVISSIQSPKLGKCTFEHNFCASPTQLIPLPLRWENKISSHYFTQFRTHCNLNRGTHGVRVSQWNMRFSSAASLFFWNHTCNVGRHSCGKGWVVTPTAIPVPCKLMAEDCKWLRFPSGSGLIHSPELMYTSGNAWWSGQKFFTSCWVAGVKELEEWFPWVANERSSRSSCPHHPSYQLHGLVSYTGPHLLLCNLHANVSEKLLPRLLCYWYYSHRSQSSYADSLSRHS